MSIGELILTKAHLHFTRPCKPNRLSRRTPQPCHGTHFPRQQPAHQIRPGASLKGRPPPAGGRRRRHSAPLVAPAPKGRRAANPHANRRLNGVPADLFRRKKGTPKKSEGVTNRHDPLRRFFVRESSFCGLTETLWIGRGLDRATLRFLARCHFGGKEYGGSRRRVAVVRKASRSCLLPASSLE